jgi:hypothetical protein
MQYKTQKNIPPTFKKKDFADIVPMTNRYFRENILSTIYILDGYVYLFRTPYLQLINQKMYCIPN